MKIKLLVCAVLLLGAIGVSTSAYVKADNASFTVTERNAT
ncbi:hypothetical protein J31TS2_21800 [Bacillus licheniformis]|nr:hypothetical protein J31TS2_21800 [Bacillus licheniformis]GIN29661.1 hypothetical protein J2TS5_17000 [Bacillus licheniformis]